MLGCFDKKIRAGFIVIPKCWRAEEWYWTAYQLEGSIVLQCRRPGAEEKSEDGLGESVAVTSAAALRQCGRFLRMPDILLQHMKRTRQDTVTLVGLGDGFEIWTTEDYRRIEKKSEKQLCDLLQLLADDKDGISATDDDESTTRVEWQALREGMEDEQNGRI